MIALRALWITTPQGAMIYSRRFPTVELRQRSFECAYVEIPKDRELAEASAVAATAIAPADSEDPNPVYTIGKDALWPVVIIRRHNALFCACPIHEASPDPNDPRDPLILMPEVTMTLDILNQLSELASPQIGTEPTVAMASDLEVCVSLALPFGAPLDMNPQTIRAVLRSRLPPRVPEHKLPAWKPFVFRGKQQLIFLIRETIRAVQYDNPAELDVWDVNGTIKCKAELEGIPDVTVTLRAGVGLDGVTFHTCVHAGDASLPSTVRRQLSFSPPLEQFSLCHFRADGVKDLPIRGGYQVKAEGPAVGGSGLVRQYRATAQLKLGEHMPNSFDYCELRLPFPNHGLIRSVDATASVGTCVVGNDRRHLRWTIGTRFSGRGNELSLSVLITFDPDSRRSTPDADPSHCHLNVSALLYFKMIDCSLADCSVDSIAVFPSTKFKLSIGRELISNEYRIRNKYAPKTPSLLMPSFLGTS